MERRRVLLYSDGPVYSGAERYLVELARGLMRAGHDASVVCSEEGAVDQMAQELTESGVKVARLPAIPTLKAKGAFLKVTKFFTTHRPDILHFNLSDPRACNGAMTAARAALRSHFITTEHLPMSEYDGKPLPLRHRMASRHTWATIVHTEFGKSVVENRPHFAGQVMVIPNGISDPGTPTPGHRIRTREALGLPESGPLVAWVGRFVPQKDPTLMLEGIRRVGPERPDVRFLFFGDGPDFHPVQHRVQELGLATHCHFFGHRSDARDLLSGCDLLVNTSRFEGMPLTILEAMFAGIPTAGASIHGNTELIAHGATGFLFAPGDGDALGHALREALRDEDRLVRLGKAARQRALALHNVDTMCRRTAALYELSLAN